MVLLRLWKVDVQEGVITGTGEQVAVVILV
jgi:hypothetical protein